MTREREEQALELYQEGKLTMEQIAERVGVSRATIYTWRHRWSNPPRQSSGVHPTDVEIVGMAEHMRTCEDCRRGFARILYEAR